MTLEQFKDKHYGVRGTGKRDQLEAGYQNFKIGALIHEARLEKGLTQEQLAEKVGTTKSYISKIENNIKKPGFQLFKKLWRLASEENYNCLLNFDNQQTDLNHI